MLYDTKLNSELEENKLCTKIKFTIRISSVNLLKKSFMENFIFYAVPSVKKKKEYDGICESSWSLKTIMVSIFSWIDRSFTD